MSRQINQPINQVRLTNVAVVRMNKGGKRFEIACYRNKVVDYRQGLETDLSEVLQTERIFTNVSKGEFSKAKDLQKVFGTTNEEEIARVILSNGQVQVSDKERSQQLEKTTAQIAEWISKNCVQPKTERPYTISQIRHAMQNANFSVHPTKPLKRQYLDCVKLLQQVMPIQRAKMELLLLIPDATESVDVVEGALKEHGVEWTSEDLNSASSPSRRYKVCVDPSLYRVLNETIQGINGAQVEIVTQVVTKQGDVELEMEMDQSVDFMAGTAALNDTVGEVEDSLNRLQVGKSGNAAGEHGDGNEEHGEILDEDEDEPVVNSRKQQKKNKKKNQKNQRREENVDTPPVVATPAQAPVSTSTPTPTPSEDATLENTSGTSSSRNSCNTCGGNFSTPAAYRAHFKSDWHKFNQKLKMKGTPPISEQEFLMCDAESFFGDGAELM